MNYTACITNTIAMTLLADIHTHHDLLRRRFVRRNSVSTAACFENSCIANCYAMAQKLIQITTEHRQTSEIVNRLRANAAPIWLKSVSYPHDHLKVISLIRLICLWLHFPLCLHYTVSFFNRVFKIFNFTHSSATTTKFSKSLFSPLKLMVQSPQYIY